MTIVYFFFFKQKTAYEMRISDWSSDVCSSDLGGQAAARDVVFDQQEMPRPAPHAVVAQALEVDAVAGSQAEPGNVLGVGEQHAALAEHAAVAVVQAVRSEAHTSELQSLMRNSYAVFCLKKQKLK